MTENEPLTVHLSVDGDTVHVRLIGELDIATSPLLLDQVCPLVDAGVREVVIDAAELTFMDSSGIGSLLEIRRLGAPVVVHRPTERVRKLLELIVLDPAVTVRD